MNVKQLKEAIASLPDELELCVAGRSWAGIYTPLSSFRVIRLTTDNLFNDDLHLVGKTAVILGEHDTYDT